MNNFIHVFLFLCAFGSVCVLHGQTPSKQNGVMEGRSESRKQNQQASSSQDGEWVWRVLNRVQGDDPELAEELKRLRKQNPQEFRCELDKINQRYLAQAAKEREEVRMLVERYRNSKKDKAIKAKIKDTLKRQFEKRLEDEKKRLTNMRKRYEHAKNRYEARCQNKETIIESKLNELLLDPELRW